MLKKEKKKIKTNTKNKNSKVKVNKNKMVKDFTLRKKLKEKLYRSFRIKL